MNQNADQTTLESRAGRAVYMVPVVLALGAVSLAVAWVIMQLVDVDRSQLDLLGPLFVLSGLASVTVAALWAWGGRRSRVVITPDRLTVSPTLGKSRSVRLSRLASVDMLHVTNGQSRMLNLTDADGAAAQIGLGGIWELEADILRLISDAARETGAKVDRRAEQALVEPK